MKAINKFSLVMVFILLFGCVSQFEDFKKDNEALTGDDVSAAYFFTNTEVKLWVPWLWQYFFGGYNYSPMFAGYTSIGHKSHWEKPDVLFNADRGWNSSFAWTQYANYYSSLDLFLSTVEPGADLENPLMEAIGKIMKASYFALYSDMFGEIPFSEVGQQGVLTPKYDTQKAIYEGVIVLLDEAIVAIGDETATGEGGQDIKANDVVFWGDLQAWKAYANSLKLRTALRAKGAPGADFADAAITSALNGPFLTKSVFVRNDFNVSFGISATAGDILNLYKMAPQRMLTDKLINLLQDNNDPRLDPYASPIIGGEIIFSEYTTPANKELIDYLLQNLDRAGVVYASNPSGSDLVINIDENKFYAGMPQRFVDNMKTFLFPEMFSQPNEKIEGEHSIGEEIDRMVMPMAEVYFMQAEAAVLGFGGNANALYQAGIQASFDQWEVSDNGYLASPIATLSGSREEQLQQIGLQSWLAFYMTDFQGWAIARDFGLDEIADDLPDLPNIFNHTNQLGSSYPERMKYGSDAYALNGDNVAAANASQGPDKMGTQLWFTKGTK